MAGKLFLVPTPIGNLEDITLRAIRILRESDLILAEDTRKSGILLRHYEISTKMAPFHKFNEHKTLNRFIEILKSGSSVALISDAGTPGISDPGFLLVREASREGIRVECLPGATSVIPALVNSGFPSDRFVFEGFLPQKKGRKSRLEALQSEKRTIVFFESPHRLVKALKELAEVFSPEHLACVCRELTKIHEENRKGTLSDLIDHYTDSSPKGEIVLVFSPSRPDG